MSKMKLQLSLKTIIIGVLIVIGFLVIQVQSLEKTTGTNARADSGNSVRGAQEGNAITDNDNGIIENADAAELEITDDDHIRGSKDADIVIIEFSDFECPYCSKLHPTLEQVVEEYDGQVAWVFKNFPLSNHRFAKEKAIAAECVAQIGGNDAFWDFADGIFNEGTNIPLSALPAIASDAGVDVAAFEACTESEETASLVEEQQSLGYQYGVSGTPGNVIYNRTNGDVQLVPGALPFDSFKQLLDGMLAS